MSAHYPADPGPGGALTGAIPGTLRDLLRATPRLAPDRAARILAGVARALGAWQARTGGHAHGALTPERILLGAGDGVSLAPPPRADGTPPSPTYLAPEQIDGRPGDARSDMYALGLIGWEVLAGQQPWEGESLYGVVVKQREHDLPRLSTLRPGLPRTLVTAIDGCLHKAPGDRWQTSDEFLDALVGPATRPIAVPPEVRELGRDLARDVPRRPLPPAGTVAGVVARAAAAGAVPGAAPDEDTGPVDLPRPTGVVPPRPAARPAAAPPADPPPPVGAAAAAAAVPPESRARPVVPPAPAPAAARPRRRLAGAVLALAVLLAGGAAVVAVRGRDAGRGRQQQPAVFGEAVPNTVGAATPTTTKQSTTAVPIRRSGGSPRPAPAESPLDPDAFPDSAAPAPPDDEPTLSPTPPFVPPGAQGAAPFPARPPRPGVPRPSVPPPDSAAVPDSLDAAGAPGR